MNNGKHSAKSFAKRLIFAVLRMRQPIWLFDAPHAFTGSRLRVIHMGDASRGRAFIRRFYGTYPDPVRLGQSWMRPSGPNGTPALPHHDLLLVEINRLFAQRYRSADFVTIPEWVEFGRPVVADPQRRYEGASKSLKCDLKAIRDAGYRVVVTTKPADFELFHGSMYLPHLTQHFGDDAIRKSRRRLQREFHNGFLMLVQNGQRFVAGALVSVNGGEVSETTLGVPAGGNASLSASPSGVIDYHLQQWAADHGKRFLRVGHTRPFPDDGVYFNKRKWQMSIMPDADGVMDMAIKVPRAAPFPHQVLEESPFVFSGRRGLGVFAARRSERKLDLDESRKWIKRLWTDGLSSLILVCPDGFRPGVAEQFGEIRSSEIYLCPGLEQALDLYRTQV